MTAQEIFDHVAAHLLQQNAQIGCLIRDDEYDPRMEEINLIGLHRIGLLPPRLKPHERLLNNLQDCHDKFEPREWPAILFEIADEHSLDPHVVYAKEGEK